MSNNDMIWQLHHIGGSLLDFQDTISLRKTAFKKKQLEALLVTLDLKINVLESFVSSLIDDLEQEDKKNKGEK